MIKQHLPPPCGPLQRAAQQHKSQERLSNLLSHAKNRKEQNHELETLPHRIQNTLPTSMVLRCRWTSRANKRIGARKRLFHIHHLCRTFLPVCRSADSIQSERVNTSSPETPSTTTTEGPEGHLPSQPGCWIQSRPEHWGAFRLTAIAETHWDAPPAFPSFEDKNFLGMKS